MKRRKYTQEFRRNAAELVLDHDYTIGQACIAVETNDKSLRRWIKQLKDERKGITPTSSKALTPEQREIQQLKRKIRKLEREKEILKKAAALLMLESSNILD